MCFYLSRFLIACSVGVLLFSFPTCSQAQVVGWQREPDLVSLQSLSAQIFETPPAGTFLANRVNIQNLLEIREIIVYYTNSSGTWNANTVTGAILDIFVEDELGLKQVPGAGIGVGVTIEDAGSYLIIRADLQNFPALNLDEVWISLTPITIGQPSTSQEFQISAVSPLGTTSCWRNPDGMFGLGNDWIPTTDFPIEPQFIQGAMTILGVPNIGVPEVRHPETMNVFRGVLLSGTVDDLESPFDETVDLNPGFTINSSEAPVWVELETSNVGGNVLFYLKSQADTPGLTYTIEAFNWTTRQYEVIAAEEESFTDSFTTEHDGFSNSDFHGPNGEARARIGWRQTGFTILFPWTVEIDSVRWNIF